MAFSKRSCLWVILRPKSCNSGSTPLIFFFLTPSHDWKDSVSRVCPSVHPGSFHLIGTLVFYETLHGVGAHMRIHMFELGVLGKFPSGKNNQQSSKTAEKQAF